MDKTKYCYVFGEVLAVAQNGDYWQVSLKNVHGDRCYLGTYWCLYEALPKELCVGSKIFAIQSKKNGQIFGIKLK